MKQKIVIKVQMSGDKSRSKALGLIASTHGVQSVAIEGREMDHLVVAGDGLDAVSLTSYLRRKVGSAQIVQVPQQQWQPRYYSSYYSRPAAVHPYTGQHRYEYDDYSHPDEGSSCAIM